MDTQGLRLESHLGTGTIVSEYEGRALKEDRRISVGVLEGGTHVTLDVDSVVSGIDHLTEMLSAAGRTEELARVNARMDSVRVNSEDTGGG